MMFHCHTACIVFNEQSPAIVVFIPLCGVLHLRPLCPLILKNFGGVFSCFLCFEVH